MKSTGGQFCMSPGGQLLVSLDRASVLTDLLSEAALANAKPRWTASKLLAETALASVRRG
jgi:hypothetical protein